MKKHAYKVFSNNSRLLSINIDLESTEDKLNTELSRVKTVIEKQSKDIIFLKTILLKDKKILVQATALWVNRT
tara:strand:+ start:81 stop:299 length:219 start_codon:yes stop_codon:yes gene_type:complete